jgi:hypothetical protein
MTEPSLFQLPQVLSGYAAKPHAKRRERTGTPGTDEQNAENKMAEGRMESRSSNLEVRILKGLPFRDSSFEIQL